jgi:hypothetical protein
MAILGMLAYCPLLSPSWMFLGRRNRVTGLVSVMGLSPHLLVTIDLGIVIWRRHLPSCMTSGKSTPQGTLLSWKCPLASVNAEAIGAPDTWPSQVEQVTPLGIGSSAAFGMDTITLYSWL